MTQLETSQLYLQRVRRTPWVELNPPLSGRERYGIPEVVVRLDLAMPIVIAKSKNHMDPWVEINSRLREKWQSQGR